MHIEDYGDWTRIRSASLNYIWEPDHIKIKQIHSDLDSVGPVVYEDGAHGYAHYTNGKFVKGFGFYANELTGNKVTIPEFEMVSNPTVRIAEVRQRRFNIIDRAAEASRKAQKNVRKKNSKKGS